MDGLLGLDLGTGSAKAVVTDLDGKVLVRMGAEYPVIREMPGQAETDPQDWWTAIVACVRRCLAEVPVQVLGIGLSGQMHGAVPLAGDGSPVYRALLWADTRAGEQAGRYQDLGDATLARLANPVFPGMAGPLLAWYRDNRPEEFARTRWAVQPKDWLRFRLVGELAGEPSDASATLLYDLVADTWDTQVAISLGLDPAMLAPLLPSAQARAGTLLPQAAEDFGLPAGIPVAAGAADTAASLFGSGCVAAGDAQLTIGSAIQVVAAHPDPPQPRSKPVTHLYRSAATRGWYEMAAVLGGGLTLGWVREQLQCSWDELYAAAAIEPRADDPVFLPQLQGERTPYVDAGLRAAWLLLDPSHTRERMLRAALEGVAMSIRFATRSLKLPDDVTLRLAGGGALAPAWRQLVADVVPRPLFPADAPDASGRGAAMLGAIAAGVCSEADALRKLRPPLAEVIQPRAEVAESYAARADVWDAAVHAVRQWDLDCRGITAV
jgi:xylulokinase